MRNSKLIDDNNNKSKVYVQLDLRNNIEAEPSN